MTRPPPFSPLSVCPKPLPGPRPFGTRTPAQAASSPRLSDRGRKGTRVLFILSHFPRQCKSFAPLFAKKARADNLRGQGTPIKTCSCMPAYANAAQSAAIRGDAPSKYGARTGTKRSRQGNGASRAPPPLRVRCTRSGGGAPVRGRLTFHDSNRQPLRPSQRSSRSSRTLPSKRADGALIADPRTSAAAVAAFFAGPYDFSERFVLPSLAFP